MGADVATITNEEEFEAWLENQPQDWAVVLAARVALRVLPLIGTWQPKRIDSIEARNRLILMTFRATAATWVAARYPARRADGLFSARSGFVASASGFAASASGFAAYAARSAAAARSAHAADASVAAYAARSACAAAAAASASSASSSAAAASAARSGFGASATIWQSITADATELVLTGRPATLAGQPLWRDSASETIGEAWNDLKADLLGQGTYWTVWTEWYEARLAGKQVRRKDVETFRVTLDDAAAEGMFPDRTRAEWDEVLREHEADWKKGPAHVNALIKARIESRGAKGSTKPDNDEGTATRSARSSQAPKAKSALGKIVIANAQSLTEQIDLLIEAIDLRREDLESHKPNDEEDYAVWKIEHDNILDLAARVHALEKSVRDFLACQGPEDAIEPAVVSFSNSLKIWWSKHDQQVINSAWRFTRRAGKLGVIVASAGVGASIGWPLATMSVAIALIGGDKLIEQVGKIKLPKGKA